jgi:hypothetical protein
MAKGDHVYVNRYGGAYSHHGIDCGDNSVIHYSGKDWSKNRIVRQTSMEEFSCGEQVLIRDYSTIQEVLLTPGTLYHRVNYQLSQFFNQVRGFEIDALDVSPAAAVARAEARLGERSFHVLLHNCEHFATWCKTGVNNSEQVNLVLKALFYNEALSHLPPHKLFLSAQEVLLEALEPERSQHGKQ